VRKVSEAIITVETPYFNGQTIVLCFSNPIYDLIIENISGVKNFDSSDVESHNRQNSIEEVLAVQTRFQKLEPKKPKLLQVPTIVDPGIGKDGICQAQQEDKSLQHIEYLVPSGEKRKTGKCNTVWFINDKG